MTMIPKPISLLKKAQQKKEAEAAKAAAAAMNDNALIYFEDEKDIAAPWPLRRSVAALTTGAAVVTLLVCAALVYHHCEAAQRRVRAFCAVPIPKEQMRNSASPVVETNYQLPALRWSTGPDPDVQVFSTLDDAASRDLVTFLKESLDIQDSVEKITVFDNGKHINFIHDFSENVTGIIDVDRCFSMELEPDWVLSPEVFTLSIERGSGLDTSVVRSVWRAMLPPLSQLASWARPLCADKPVYRLDKEEKPIRKRSAEEPAHEYMHFSGNHVQAIAIDNLAEIQQYEDGLKQQEKQ